MTISIWCLLTDHEGTPVGGIFEVALEVDIDDLKKAVKKEIPNTLARKGVGIDQLTVLRGKGSGAIIDDFRRDSMCERVHGIMSLGTHRLASNETIADLAITDKEALLIQLPGASSTLPLST